MSDKIKHIKRKIKIPQIKLWLVWFFLFVFPCIMALIGYEQFCEKYSFFVRTDLIYKAYEDIRKYNEAIAPERFIEDQIKEIQKLDSTLPFKKLKYEIDRKLCGESLFCLFFDEKVEKVSILKAENEANELKNLPVHFFKKNINSLIENELPKNNKNTDLVKTYETNEQFAFLLQQIFKTATNIIIHLNKVSKNFSVKYDGELYFILCNFNSSSKKCMGFFAVIQGKSFNFHKMLEKLNADYPEIRIVFKEVDVNKTEETPELFHSGIKQDKDGLHIIAPASAKFVRHVLHSGTTSLNKKYGKLFPFIDYQIPLWKFGEKVKNVKDSIRKIALLIIFLSGIYFLKVSLFGFNDKSTFKNKIISLLLIATIFPFGIFCLSLHFINKTENFINKLQVQNYVENMFELHSQELDEYKGKLESYLVNSAQEISYLINKSNNASEISEYFKSIGEDIPISTAVLYFNPPPDKLKNLCKDNKIDIEYSDRISNSQGKYNKDALTDKYLELTLQFAKVEKITSRKPENKLEILGKEYDSEVINDFLKDKGTLISINRIQTVYYFSLNYIYDYSNKVIGLLTANLEPKPILKSFLEKKSSLYKKNFSENKEKYNIDYAIIPLENSGSCSIWNGSGIIDSEDKKFCLQDTASGIIENENKILIKRRNQFIPHLAVATVRKINKYDETLFIIEVLVGLIVYLSLILYFSNILLNMLIVDPVLLMASNARAIANGSDKWETEIKSGDEFEELNNSFKQFVNGLKERNILKSYVSEDAFSDIEGSDNLKLLPGGEYLEATIVFSSIKDYDKLSSSMTPEESIKLLSKFMSIAEEVTKKYGGSIDKIIGDTIMLVFRDNPNKESHGLRAAKASLELVKKAKASELPKLYTGIASGRVISGRIGSYSGKLDFTVIGNPVNSASRFKTESKNGTTETGIIFSGTTIGLTKGKARVKYLRRVSIKGKVRKYNIYELIGIRNQESVDNGE